MSTISLQRYHEEINKLYKNEVFDEVVGHCNHILKHFPKELATYQLLGSALLQLKQLTEARDVFRRILSADPRDYTAHQGLSHVAATEEAWDAALWHMERIFEAYPGNASIVNELRRLYLERDGHEIERVQLTRMALAQQYVNGQHYHQAITELRQAIEQHPNRPDMQLLLAETLYADGQDAEAGEHALALLEALPDCLPANQLMAQLWLDNKRPEDAKPFLKRVTDIAPYTGVTMISGDAAATAFQLPRLDWRAEALSRTTSVSPDWLDEFSGELPDDNVFTMAQESSSAGDAPSWFMPGADLAEQAGTASAPNSNMEDWFSDLQSEVPEEPAALPVSAEDLPDLFDDMAFDAPEDIPLPDDLVGDDEERYAPEGFTGFLDDLSTSSDDAPADDEVDTLSKSAQPGWLADISEIPPDEEDEDAFDLPDMDDLFAAAEVPALEEAPPQAERSVTGMTDWLSDLTDDDEEESEPADPQEPPAPLREEHRLTELFSAEDFDEADDNTLPPLDDTMSDTPPERGDLSLTGLFQSSDFEDPDDTPEMPSTDELFSEHLPDSKDLTDFLDSQTSSDEEYFMNDPEEQPGSDFEDSTEEPNFDDLFGESRASTGLTSFLDEDEVEDFELDLGSPSEENLEDIFAATRPPSDDEVAELLASARGAEVDSEPEAAPAEDIPDWMGSLDSEPEAEPAEEIPDWMGSLDSEPEAEPAEDIPDWMGSLDGEPEAEPAEDIPDWMGSLDGESEAAPAEDIPDWMGSLDSEPEAAPAEDIPDWMGSLEGEPEAAPAEDIPDWMGSLEGEPEAAPAEDIPDWMGDSFADAESKAEAAEDMPNWLGDAFAEAESEAEAAEDTLDWMGDSFADAESEAEAAEAMPTGHAEDILSNTLSEADIPDWLGGLAEDMPDDEMDAIAAPDAQADPPAPASQDMPDWLKTASVEEDAPAFPANLPEMNDAPESTADMPDWLTSFSEDAPEEDAEAMLAQAPDMADNNLALQDDDPEDATAPMDFSFNYDFLDVRPAWLRDADDASDENTGFTPPWLRDS